MTPDQRVLLEDKVAIWRKDSMQGNMELRDYNRRCADALEAALSTQEVTAQRAEATPVDDDLNRAFIDGWNARFDYTDFDLALHFWMLAGAAPLVAAQETTDRVEALREALEQAALWHEEQDKAISKQPNANSGDNGWRRLNHQEQTANIRAALNITPQEAADNGRG